MTDNPNFLDDKDVIFFQPQRFDFDETMKTEQIKQKINRWVMERFKTGKGIFPDFVEKCEVLQQNGKGWRKGKIRIRFEFIPDQPEQVEEENKSNKGTLDEFRN
jgi:hypothetical protein